MLLVESKPNLTQFGSLDGLRALAVAGVVWHHAGDRGLGPPIAQRGFLGVDLFFVISGFLITRLLLREQQSLGRIHLRAFFARRALRLMPLYYLVLLVMAVLLGLVWPGAPMAEAYFRDLPYYATYTSNWIVPGTILALSWSLALEEQFYLTWPLVLRFARRTAGSALLVACGASLLMHGGLLDSLLDASFGERWRLMPVWWTGLTSGLAALVIGVRSLRFRSWPKSRSSSSTNQDGRFTCWKTALRLASSCNRQGRVGLTVDCVSNG